MITPERCVPPVNAQPIARVRYGTAVPRPQDMTDSSLAKALSHPLRGRILSALENRTASPSALAEDLDASLGVVSYHVRRLHALGFLRLVKRVPRRGAVEHYYTTVSGPRISSQAWEATPAVVKQAVLGATLGEIGSQASAAAEAGGFEPREAHLSRSPVTVDHQGWQQLAGELDALVSRIQEISAASNERLSRDGSESARTAMVALMLFQTSEPASPEPAPAQRRGADQVSPPARRRKLKRLYPRGVRRHARVHGTLEVGMTAGATIALHGLSRPPDGRLIAANALGWALRPRWRST